MPGTDLQRIEDFVPLLFSGGVAAAGVPGDGGFRLGLVLLLVKGWDLLCSPVSFPFRVGDAVASGGFSFRSPDLFLVTTDRWLGQDFFDDGRCTTTLSHAASNC